MSIRYMYQKLKSFVHDDTIFAVVMIVLVSIASFGLGRVSVLQTDTILNKASPTTALRQLEPLSVGDLGTDLLDTLVVASQSGTKYHLPTCPGVKQIKIENRIEFSSIKEAKAAGYRPAGNCPGLE